MNSTRFQILLDAFGGNLSRWPDSERAAAWRFAIAHPMAARRILATARSLDRILDRSPAPAVSPDLRDRIARAAPHARAPSSRRRSFNAAWLGAGLATACMAGVGAGLTVTPLAADRGYVSGAIDPAEDAAAALREPSEFGEG